MKFKIKEDLTSDVMFEAYGKNLKEVFQNSALALSSIICKVKKIKPLKKVEVKIKAKNPSELMFSWLQELIALVDLKEMFFSKFIITKITKTELNAKIYGQEITPELGETVVKALTNYKFELKKTRTGYKTTVVVDI